MNSMSKSIIKLFSNPVQPFAMSSTTPTLNGAQPILSNLLRERRSIRSYKADRIPDNIISSILEDATHSPSWCNTQPYYICYAEGARKESIKSKLCKKYDDAMVAKSGGLLKKLSWWKGGGYPDGDFSTQFTYPKHLNDLRIKCAKGLYDLLGIERHDE